MRKIFTFGETVLDIIFKNSLPVKSNPGGSMLNSAVTLGRLKKPIYFVTEFGDDFSGKMIIDFLKDNSVNTDYIYLYKDGQTILAMAFLDDNNNAEYDFYKIFPSKRFNMTFPLLEKEDIFLFGSFLSIDKEVRPKIKDFVSAIKDREAIIVYDPNFRSSYLNELEDLLPFIRENISFSDILKGSDEDFFHIFKTDKPEEIYDIVHNLGCKNLVVTRGAKDVVVKTENMTEEYPINKIKVKSTIGAGDNFNAGILYSLYVYNIKKEELNSLDSSLWGRIIKNSAAFSANVCQSYDNYISKDFAESLEE